MKPFTSWLRKGTTPRPIRTAMAMTLVAFTTFVAVAVAAPPASAAAWDCPSGNVCVWDGDSGTGSRCKWSSKDPDWLNGTVVCSWALNRPVRSMLNHGTSSSFSGVCLYPSENYIGTGWWLAQNWGIADHVELDFLSHKWVTGGC